ncbi:RNA polymerase sigma factor [Nocardiopsis sp. CNR-923]|uniref:RNA polymerase sigma factor n=1 Tax=Nocardiopsis sp. CNR-923 TaxID=1904965 RepID=UPI002916D170|nr:RNA polymerase sigma factor [Nocardiopsis sp. CNR-923]
MRPPSIDLIGSLMPETVPRGSALGGAESDAVVVQRSLADPAVFGEIFRRHAPALHRYVARRLGTADADDIVAEAFHIAFRERHRYDADRPDSRPWLWRIATNLVRRRHRSETRAYRALARTGTDPVMEASPNGPSSAWTRPPSPATWPRPWRACPGATGTRCCSSPGEG